QPPASIATPKAAPLQSTIPVDLGHSLPLNETQSATDRPLTFVSVQFVANPEEAMAHYDPGGTAVQPLIYPLARRVSKAVSRARAALFCRQCGIRETPQWRKGPAGPRTLCNKCGIRYFKSLPQQTP